MRLINTQTGAFAEFYSNVPPYAILSHRWQEEEVTFTDYHAQLRLHPADRMKGWAKIDMLVRQAKLDELGYCWIDTCCIDKTSSSELSEAINSMYAWYRDSAVCYIYMSDVDVSACTGEYGAPSQERVLGQFGASQWFTRGWTLQELLAPKNLIFYDVNWVQLLRNAKSFEDGELYGWPGFQNLRGPILDLRKKEQRAVLDKATGIDTLFDLDGFSPESSAYSVALKMSWASRRKTTRIEDMAYCLMGIFDINMPLLYGEGMKAFARLQEEIIKQTDDHTIFYWRDPNARPSCFRGLLARSPADFSESSRAKMPRSLDTGYTRGHLEASHMQPEGDRTYGMTNKGLRITLPMVVNNNGWPPYANALDNEAFVLLECEVWGQKCGLVLARVSNEGHYARVDAHKLPPTIQEPYHIPTSQQIFVKSVPSVFPNYTSSRMTRVMFNKDWEFIVTDLQHLLRPDTVLSPAGARNDPVRKWFEIGKPIFTAGRAIARAFVHADLSKTASQVSHLKPFRISIVFWWEGQGPFELKVRLERVDDDNKAYSRQMTEQTFTLKDAKGSLSISVRLRAFLDGDDELMARVGFSWGGSGNEEVTLADLATVSVS
ncbi:heterokaryon incompatibility protein-domain-containing protein [Echria macrotheca]|uniref:Heterokaryon incompatibility protein-domain-containing protein n=1 Tax=Echria macrotheca TaxID=438768 RepID=A0AAJ0F5T7_9PEZI|nr:heterokaryon incompatibility protein-domain-containing protein [Echria macrotheca]